MLQSHRDRLLCTVNIVLFEEDVGEGVPAISIGGVQFKLSRHFFYTFMEEFLSRFLVGWQLVKNFTLEVEQFSFFLLALTCVMQ